MSEYFLVLIFSDPNFYCSNTIRSCLSKKKQPTLVTHLSAKTETFHAA